MEDFIGRDHGSLNILSWHLAQSKSLIIVFWISECMHACIIKPWFLRSLSEEQVMPMIKFGPYFCVGYEDSLAKPYRQGLCIWLCWLVTALTQPEGWLRSEIQALFPPPISRALERGCISLEGYFFCLPRVTIWAYTGLRMVVAKRLGRPLTRERCLPGHLWAT